MIKERKLAQVQEARRETRVRYKYLYMGRDKSEPRWGFSRSEFLKVSRGDKHSVKGRRALLSILSFSPLLTLRAFRFLYLRAFSPNGLSLVGEVMGVSCNSAQRRLAYGNKERFI